MISQINILSIHLKHINESNSLRDIELFLPEIGFNVSLAIGLRIQFICDF